MTNILENIYVICLILIVYFSLNTLLNVVKSLIFRKNKILHFVAKVNIWINLVMVILLSNTSKILDMDYKTFNIFSNILLVSIVIIPIISYFIINRWYKDLLKANLNEKKEKSIS